MFKAAARAVDHPRDLSPAPGGAQAKEADNHPTYHRIRPMPARTCPHKANYRRRPGRSINSARTCVALGDDQFKVVTLLARWRAAGRWIRREKPHRAEGHARRRCHQAAAGRGIFRARIANGTLFSPGTARESMELKKVERESPAAGAKRRRGRSSSSTEPHTESLEGRGNDFSPFCWSRARRRRKSNQNFTMHLEFMLPFKPFARDHGSEGNSGIYIQRR